MVNVKYEVDMSSGKPVLVIRCDLSQRFGPSSSGKTEIVASTQRNRKAGVGEIRFGLNVFAPYGGGEGT